MNNSTLLKLLELSKKNIFLPLTNSIRLCRGKIFAANPTGKFSMHRNLNIWALWGHLHNDSVTGNAPSLKMLMSKNLSHPQKYSTVQIEDRILNGSSL